MTRTKSLHGIDIKFSEVSKSDIDRWLAFLENYLAQKSDLPVGALKLGSFDCDEKSRRYWFDRAMRRQNVRSCFYNIQRDESVAHEWFWTRQGSAETTTQLLPIVPVGMKKTLFLDRDGVINIDDKYIYKKENFKFMPGIDLLLQWAKKRDFQVVVLTNQSGVGRGHYRESDVLGLHHWVDEQLDQSGLKIENWFYSPFHPESEKPEYKKESYTRKPGSGMAITAADSLSIDFNHSLMVGDKTSDRLRDLDIQTLFLKGSYDLKNETPVFESHSDLVMYLEDNNF